MIPPCIRGGMAELQPLQCQQSLISQLSMSLDSDKSVVHAQVSGPAMAVISRHGRMTVAVVLHQVMWQYV